MTQTRYEFRDDPELRERHHVFASRREAGEQIAKLIEADDIVGTGIVLGLPTGGVPVAAAVAQALDLELDVAVVAKLAPVWNAQGCFGAVAFDGRVQLDPTRIEHLGLSDDDVREEVERARRKVEKRVSLFRADRAPLDVARHTVILVDDGLESDDTMKVVLAALGELGPERIIVAVATAHAFGLLSLPTVDEIVCPNVRSQAKFAIANAYQNWREAGEQEALSVLTRARAARQAQLGR